MTGTGNVTSPSVTPAAPLKFVLSTGATANGNTSEFPDVPVPATSSSVTAGSSPEMFTTLVPVGKPISVKVIKASDPAAVSLIGRAPPVFEVVMTILPAVFVFTVKFVQPAAVFSDPSVTSAGPFGNDNLLAS